MGPVAPPQGVVLNPPGLQPNVFAHTGPVDMGANATAWCSSDALPPIHGQDDPDKFLSSIVYNMDRWLTLMYKAIPAPLAE